MSAPVAWGLADADAILRSQGRHATDSTRVPWGSLLRWIVVAGCGYGALMGSYGGFGMQAFYSAAKVPLMLAVASGLALPNFFVVNTLLGLRDDFGAACRGLAAAQATMALALLSFGPITLFGYACTGGYADAKVLNGVMFAAASVCGQVTLVRHYRPLVARNPRHRVGLAAWLSLYVFVAVQLAWLLRPFIGRPGKPAAFLREDAFSSNAYVEVFSAVLQVLGG